MSTSAMSGTFRIVVDPVASKEAAISFKAEFLAPVTETWPRKEVPPTIRKRSWDAIGAVYL